MVGVVFAGFLVAACSSEEALRAVGLVEGFFGGAAGDEPHAVVVARDVLSAGGSAADAAVALYFTAAVTYPASAALGAGGVCLVYNPKERKVETLAFPPRAPAGAGKGRAVAVPGAVRGMFALHARYGKLPWSRLLSPAEELARLGHSVSRALAQDLKLVAAPLFADPEIGHVFAHADGTSLREGDELVQLDLAAALTQIRTRGPGVMYSGELAKKLVAGVSGFGGALTIEDLRGYRPVWRDTLQIRFGNQQLHTVPPPMTGGVMLMELWAMLNQNDRYEDTAEDERPHLLAEVSMRAFADRGSWRDRLVDGKQAGGILADSHIGQLMASYRGDRHTPAASLSPPPGVHRENPAGTSFVVVDGEGSAVACSITMNNLFGVGRMAPGTGIILAAAPGASQATDTALAPVMAINHNTGHFFFAAAASGGATAPVALVQTMARALIDGAPLSEAVGERRVFHGGTPDTVIHEPGESAERLEGLRQRGHRLAEVPELGRVNAIYCSEGLQAKPESCHFMNDRRGYGLANSVQF
ncbi:MAG: gamma-glutamyltransferase [Alphaproteobacteria bacterium]